MIYLVQTDTTAGFVSYSKEELNKAKNRPLLQECLQTTASFKDLKTLVRVPATFKNKVRKAKKTSFLYPNKRLVRVVKDCPHQAFLEKMGPMYSTSANLHKQGFDLEWARKRADVVVDINFFESTPSCILKLGRKKLVVIRRCFASN